MTERQTTDEGIVALRAGEGVTVTFDVKVNIDADEDDPEQPMTTRNIEVTETAEPRDVDPNSEAYLEGAGLLPPSQGWMVCEANVNETHQRDPLLSYHETTMRRLADDVMELRRYLDKAYDAERKSSRQAGKLHTAVRWLRDNRPQDDLSLRVIAYVLGEGDD